MKKYIIILTLLLINSFVSFGQKSNDSIPMIMLTTISQESVGNSYITFPTDIGNMEPLWFEGNIIPNFIIRTSKDAKWMAVLTPQIIIRMYQENSLPIKTPSYIPQITLFYSLSSESNINSLTLFGKMAHHSNGQNGDFYLADGTINLESGNFTTNYFELGFIKTNYSKRYNAVRFLSASFEGHPVSLTETELIGQYSLYRLNTVFSIFKLPACYHNSERKASFSFQLKANWMLDDFNSLAVFDLKRLNFSLRFSYYPKFLEDIGLFVQYYHGYDYYNIYFNVRRDVLRFGIITEKLRF